MAESCSGVTVFMRSDMPGLLARASAEIGHGFREVIAPLTGESGHGGVALELFKVAARANDRIDRRHGNRGVSLGGGRRACLRPWLGGEIFGERERVLLGDAFCDRRHAVVLARALLEIAELQIEIACVLAPDDRNGLVVRQPFLAVARAANRRLVFDRIRPSGGCAGQERDENNATQHADYPSRVAPICAPRHPKVK
jgi:hypothetical protein